MCCTVIDEGAMKCEVIGDIRRVDHYYDSDERYKNVIIYAATRAVAVVAAGVAT
jgi:hypothetical protein